MRGEVIVRRDRRHDQVERVPRGLQAVSRPVVVRPEALGVCAAVTGELEDGRVRAKGVRDLDTDVPQPSEPEDADPAARCGAP